MKKKKIFIDVTSLSDQYKNRGIGAYVKNLTEKLILSKKIDFHLLGFFDAKTIFPDANFHFLGSTKPSNYFNIIRFRNYLQIIDKVKPDLFFQPNFERGVPFNKVKTAVTIHDVIPLKTNKFSSKGKVANFLKSIFYRYNIAQAKKCHLIITNSRFSKNELISVGFDEKKTHFIYHGLSLFKNEKAVAWALNKSFFIYYGGIEQNKNISLLLRSFYEFKKRFNFRHKLVLVEQNLVKEPGKIAIKSADAKKVFNQIQILNLSNEVLLPGWLKREEMFYLLKRADAFIHLSKYEGFGLAVLEALSTGCPVICYQNGSYRELFSDHAILVGDDVIQIANEMRNVVVNSKKFLKEKEKRIRFAMSFSWQKCADETLSLFLEQIK